MREIHGLRLMTHEHINRCMHGAGIELNWSCRRENELADVRFELSVGNAKIVPGKNVSGFFVDNPDVVSGVPRSVKTEKLTPAKINAKLMFRLDNPARVYRQYLAVQTASRFDSVDANGAFNQSGGIGHVPCAARMHHQLRIPEVLHHQTGATRMVKMDVGQNHVINFVGGNTCLIECRQGIGQGRIAPGINKCSPAVFDNQVNRRQFRAQIIRINGENTVFIRYQLAHGLFLNEI